ncbi:MAG TPA: hypothetical protein VF412_01480 [Bdellovibrio sp.]|uniref:hypothetical protein n=1 Tax=Bdellovibrio sp. TaxID=28201 RepID=UPI002F1DCBB0
MISILKNYIRSQKNEIQQDPVLIRFSQALILVHFFTILFWFNQDFQNIILDLNQSVCWPFFTSCDVAKSFLSPLAGVILPAYFSLTILLFGLSFRKPQTVWWSLFWLEFIKLALSALDYRFMGNYHFIPHVITLYVLFFPQKRSWSKFWIFTLYIGAASLKLNWEWLSGASLSWKTPLDRPELLPWLAISGLIVEISGAQLLYFKNSMARWFGFFLLLAFHAVSFYWVGFFYPCIMLCVLSLIYFEIKDSKSPIAFKLHEKNLILPGCIWAAFCIFQVIAFSDARTASLDGMKRLASLNMFDARSTCKGLFIIHQDSSSIEIPFQNRDLPVRNKCDNIFFLAQARKICADSESHNPKVSAFLVAQRTSDSDFIDIVREEDICSRFKN